MREENLKKKVQVVVFAEQSLLLFEFNNQIPNNYVGFQNITGAVEGDETFEEAAARELSEEAGISSNVIDIGMQFSFFDRWKNNCIEKVYLCSLQTKPNIILNEEHLNYKWVPLNQVALTDYTFPTNYQAFLAAKKFTSENKI